MVFQRLPTPLAPAGSALPQPLLPLGHRRNGRIGARRGRVPAAIIQTAVSTTDPLALADPAAPDGQAATGDWEWRAGGDLRGVWFTDANTGWIAGSIGLLHTTDGGHTWTATPGMGGYRLNAVQFTDALHGWVVGDGGVILHTADGGATWSRLESGVTEDLKHFIFVDSVWGWVSTWPRPIRTTDGGTTWQPIVMPDDWAYWGGSQVIFVDRQHGWLNWYGSFYRTSDGGATWTRSGDPDPPFWPAGMFFLDTLRGWTASGARGEERNIRYSKSHH